MGRSLARKPPLILLADDLEPARGLVATELEEAGYRVVQVADGLKAWEKFQLHHFDLVVSDVRMPRSDGMALLRRIRSAQSPSPQVPVLLVSAFGDLSTATAAGRAGAADFFPFNDAGIEALIAKVAEILERAEPLLPLPLLGESPDAAHLRERVEALAVLDVPVLVCGERGTGRESIARYIHQRSRRSPLPFLGVRREAASEMLSRLPGGTVYLEDFEHFARDARESWLERVRDADALGASAPVRVLASMSEPALDLVAEGTLGEEAGRLLARFEIDVPALAHRREDLPHLIGELRRRVQQRLGSPDTCCEAGAREALGAHAWRTLDELEATIESLVASTPQGTITCTAVERALAELETPLDRIAQQRRRAERKQLLALYREHGTYSGVARELGITRNAAKYRLAKHDLLPGPAPAARGSRGVAR